MILRTANIADARALLELAREVMGEPGGTLTEWDEFDQSLAAEEQFIECALNAPRDLLLVAELNHQLVGVVNFATHRKRKRAHAGEFGMSVLKEFRDQGIGRLLLYALLDWASRQPTLERLELNVFAGNARAIYLYRSIGFEEEGRSRNAIKFADGRYDDLILMGRRNHLVQ